MRQVGERGRGSRRGSRRSPGLWLWCWGQRRPGRGKGGRGVTPSSVVTPRWEGRGMSQLCPSSGGTTLPRGGGQAGQGGAPRGLWAGSRSLFRRRCPRKAAAKRGPGRGAAGGAQPRQAKARRRSRTLARQKPEGRGAPGAGAPLPGHPCARDESGGFVLGRFCAKKRGNK